MFRLLWRIQEEKKSLKGVFQWTTFFFFFFFEEEKMRIFSSSYLSIEKNRIFFLFLILWGVFQKRRMFSPSSFSSLAKRRRKYFLFSMWRIEMKMIFFSTSLRWQKIIERIEGIFKFFLPRIEEDNFHVEELFLVPPLGSPPPPKKYINIFFVIYSTKRRRKYILKLFFYSQAKNCRLLTLNDFLKPWLDPPPWPPSPKISKIFSLSSILSKEVEENILQSFFYSQTKNSGLRALNVK